MGVAYLKKNIRQTAKAVDNKKLSYRREAVRCLVLLTIFVSR